MDEIKPGYTVEIDESDSAQYDTIASAVDSHNKSAAPGEHYWGISIENGSYTVYEYGEVPEPTPEPEPVEPTIEEIRAEKLSMASDTCGQLIRDGIDVTLSDGEKHFSLETADQNNIDGIFNAVVLGATAYPYHADGDPCEMFSASDIVTLYVAYKSFVTQQTTYCNALRQWIKREEDKDILSAIEYGTSLPDDLTAGMNKILAAANEQVQAIVSRLTQTTATSDVAIKAADNAVHSEVGDKNNPDYAVQSVN